MAGKPGDDAHLEAVANGLDAVTDQAGDYGKDPKDTLHSQADSKQSHSWMKSLFPYHSVGDMEHAWHLGNYVIDRKTGKKDWEAMSIYVRLGMHALYYGTQQEKALHWKRTIALFESQSKKMGKQYDDPQSKAHIRPFIQSFGLESNPGSRLVDFRDWSRGNTLLHTCN